MDFNTHKKVIKNGKTYYYTRVCGKWICVSKEVFQELSSSDRRERYHYARQRKTGVLSLDELVGRMEDSTDSFSLCDALIEGSPENELIAKEQRAELHPIC